MNQVKSLLSRRETMALLGNVTYRTFAKLLATGAIPRGVLVGSRERWDPDAVIAYLNARVSQQKIDRAA